MALTSLLTDSAGNTPPLDTPMVGTWCGRSLPPSLQPTQEGMCLLHCSHQSLEKPLSDPLRHSFSGDDCEGPGD